MWSIDQRAMDAKERSEIKGLLRAMKRTSQGAASILLGAGVGAFLSLLVIVLGDRLADDPSGIPWRMVGFVTLAGSVIAGFARRPAGDHESQTFSRHLVEDLVGGRVEVHTFTTTRAMRVNESDGQPGGYLVEVAEGVLMFVESRDWDSTGFVPDQPFDRMFPCSWFRIVRAPKSALEFEFHCAGDYIEPLRDRLMPPEGRTAVDFKDGCVLRGRLETLEFCLGEELASARLRSHGLAEPTGST